MKKQRTDNFDKFANQKKGSAVKEAFRQEKKKNKLAARAAGEEMRKKKIEKLRGISSDESKVQGTRFKEQDSRNKEQGPRNKAQEPRFKKQDARRKPLDTTDAKPDVPGKKKRFDKRTLKPQNEGTTPPGLAGTKPQIPNA